MIYFSPLSGLTLEAVRVFSKVFKGNIVLCFFAGKSGRRARSPPGRSAASGEEGMRE
jgi:hypothetical protein